MLTKTKEVAHKVLKHEFVRLLPLFGLAALLLFNRESSSVVLLNIGIVAAVVAISHLIRRILFPYIDLEYYANKALETPISAAIVFMSVCYILSILLQATLRLVS